MCVPKEAGSVAGRTAMWMGTSRAMSLITKAANRIDEVFLRPPQGRPDFLHQNIGSTTGWAQSTHHSKAEQ